MPKRPDDDLFGATTMSFGDHLEELRVSLFKAVLGLVLGFFVGLAFANWVVAYIQTPLKQALEDHFIKKAIGDLQTRVWAGTAPGRSSLCRGEPLGV